MTIIHQEDICCFLQQNIEPTEWQLDHPQQGFNTGQRFFATSKRHKVFIKLGIDHRIIKHLSDLHITPRYLAGGPLADTHIAVQEFVDATHPDTQWYVANKRTMAHLLQTLHRQSQLRAYLPEVADETYRSLYARYIQQTREEYYQCLAKIEGTRKQMIEGLLDAYEQRLPFVRGEGLVPSHCDPNPGNVLATAAGAYLIDWDQLHLSDPIRDIAQVLWWQYPLAEWDELLGLFAIDLTNEQQRERFFLSVSIWSLHVSLFFTQLPHERYAAEFLIDAQRTFHQELPNRLL